MPSFTWRGVAHEHAQVTAGQGRWSKSQSADRCHHEQDERARLTTGCRSRGSRYTIGIIESFPVDHRGSRTDTGPTGADGCHPHALSVWRPSPRPHPYAPGTLGCWPSHRRLRIPLRRIGRYTRDKTEERPSARKRSALVGGQADVNPDISGLVRPLEETVPAAALSMIREAATADDPELFAGVPDDETFAVAERIYNRCRPTDGRPTRRLPYPERRTPTVDGR